MEHGVELPFEEQMRTSVEGTRKILACLARHRVKATFFCTANFALHAKDLILDIQKGGHEIASHGFYHSSFETADLRKSKEALELLRQWSKEGEYFSSKIKEVTGHIDGLNAEVNKWQSKYNSERRMVEQMSDYNKAANSTIEEQEYEIGRLIRQNARYRELLDRIPDEIYEEITNTRSKNRDRGER